MTEQLETRIEGQTLVVQMDVQKLGYPGTVMSLCNVVRDPSHMSSESVKTPLPTRRFRVDVVLSTNIELNAFGVTFAPEYEAGGSLLRMPNPGELRCSRGGVELVFKPDVDKESRLRGFGTFVEAVDFDSAVDTVRTVLFPLLSYVSFRAQVPIYISKIVGASEDRKEICARFVAPDRECWIESSFGTELSNDYQSLFAVYRESKTSPSYYYRFICLYKIMEAIFGFYRKQKTDRAKLLGLELRRDGETIPDLEGSAKRFPRHIGKGFRKFFEEVLTPRYRHALVHFFTDKTTTEPLNLDDAPVLRRYEEVYPVMDFMARKMLENEIRIEKMIAEARASSH